MGNVGKLRKAVCIVGGGFKQKNRYVVLVLLGAEKVFFDATHLS